MTDMFGIPLKVGDEVIVSQGAQSETYLQVATIEEIKYRHVYVRYKESGRKAMKSRGSNSLVSVAPIKAQHPEAFI